MPITSIGVITVRSSTAGLEYLLVRRKDTLGYIDFLRGKYNISSKFHIMNLINEMTIHEKKNLTTFTFTELWGKLWGDSVGIQYRNEEHSSKDKFMTLKTGVMMNGEVYNLEQLISEIINTEKTHQFPTSSTTNKCCPICIGLLQEKPNPVSFFAREENKDYEVRDYCMSIDKLPACILLRNYSLWCWLNNNKHVFETNLCKS